jgi:hypothetical protein
MNQLLRRFSSNAITIVSQSELDSVEIPIDHLACNHGAPQAVHIRETERYVIAILPWLPGGRLKVKVLSIISFM